MHHTILMRFLLKLILTTACFFPALSRAQTATFELGKKTYAIEAPLQAELLTPFNELSPLDQEIFLDKRSQILKMLAKWLAVPALKQTTPRIYGVMDYISSGIHQGITGAKKLVRWESGGETNEDTPIGKGISERGHEMILKLLRVVDTQLWQKAPLLAKSESGFSGVLGMTLGAGLGKYGFYFLTGIGFEKRYDATLGKNVWRFHFEVEKMDHGFTIESNITLRLYSTNKVPNSDTSFGKATALPGPLVLRTSDNQMWIGAALSINIVAKLLGFYAIATGNPMLATIAFVVIPQISSIGYVQNNFKQTPLDQWTRDKVARVRRVMSYGAKPACSLLFNN